MKRLFTLLTLLFATCIAAYGQANGKLLISAHLTGAQEVPAVTTGASGVAGFLLSPNHDSLFINVTATGLSGPITGIHMHEALKGINGGVVKDLGAFIVGNTVSTVITGTALTKEIISKLLGGRYYVNIHTALNPNGEIRGQLAPEADLGFYGVLQGSQEVPPTGAPGYGWVAAVLSKDRETITIWMVCNGLTDVITGAHLHRGAMGTNGPVVVDLTTAISGRTLNQTEPAALIADDLLGGSIYLNVHTTTFPGGELRAQLVPSDNLNFVAWLDATEEVPVTTAVGRGVAFFRLSHGMDSLRYDVLIDSISGPLTGAHIHGAPRGVNGQVIIDLSAGINGNGVSGMATGFTKAHIDALMRGNAYINVHTSGFPNGEIRGQLRPFARTGFTVVLSGLQQVPAVATGALGSGIVSLDATNTLAYFRFAVNGLSGPVTSAHFHDGAAGVNGSVVEDITWAFGKAGPNDTAGGFWKAVTDSNAQKLLSGKLYVNIHTALHQNGEVRGQVTDEGKGITLPMGIEPVTGTNITVYPNPATNKLYISSVEDVGNIPVKITDIQGKELKLPNTTGTFGAGNNEINIEALPAGLYFLNIETNGQVLVTKFIKR